MSDFDETISEEPKEPTEPEIDEEELDDEEDVDTRIEKYEREKNANKPPEPQEPKAPDNSEPKADDNQKPEEQAKPEGKKDEKPPEKLKLKVAGEEVELSIEEVQRKVNEAEYALRSRRRLQEAGEAMKKAEQLDRIARGAMDRLTVDAPGVLMDIMTAKTGSQRAAREAVARMLEPFMESYWTEKKLQREKPEEYRTLQARQEYEAIIAAKRRAEEELQAQHAARQSEAEQRALEEAELHFQDEVVGYLNKFDIPNDRMTEYLYQQAEKAAQAAGLEWSPRLAAEIIRDERQKLIPAPPAPQAEPLSDEKKKLADIEAAKQKRIEDAKGKRAGQAKSAPGSLRSPRSRPITTDDLRERIF